MRKLFTHFSACIGSSTALLMMLLLPLLGWGQTIATQDFEGTVPAGVSLNNGTLRTGTLASPGLPSSAPYATSPSQGFTVTNLTGTAEASANISLAGYTNVSVSFRLSGMSTSATNGIDAGDYVYMEISLDGGSTWSREISVSGATSNQRWTYSGTGAGSTAYDGNNTPTLITSSSTNGVGTVTVSGIPVVAPNNQLRYRIVLFNNDSAERWAIDDVVVSGTAVVTTPNLGVSVAALTAFSTTTGTPSAAQSYTLTGSNLAADVTVTPPTGYQVSQTSATAGFAADGTAITVARSSGSVSAPLYVRLSGNTVGTYGTSSIPLNITHVSTTASANKAVYGAVSDPTINGVALSPTAVCTTSGDGSTSVSFTTNGAFTGSYTVQLSDASGDFTTPLATASGTGSPIVLNVPQGTATGTGYLVRVLNSSPAATSNTAALTVVNNPVVTISPATAQSITTDQAVSFSATETPAATSRQWKYGTTVGSYTTNGGTTLTYSFAPTTPGTYYVVLQSTFAGCGVVTSNPTPVTVTSPAPTLSTLSPASAQTGTTTSVTLTGTGFNTTSVVNFNGATLTPVFTSITSLTVSLPAPGTAGVYPVSVTNPTPGGGTSGSQNFTAVDGPLATYTAANINSSAANLPVSTTAANVTATNGTRGSGAPGIASVTATYGVKLATTSATTLAGAITNNAFIEYTVVAGAGYLVSVTDIVVNAYRSSSGPNTLALVYSTNGTFSASNQIGSSQGISATLASSPSTLTFSTGGTVLQNQTGTVTYRLYYYNTSANGSGTGGGNTYLLDGSTKAIIVNGLVTAGTPVPDINIAQGSTSYASGTGSYAFATPTMVGSSTAATQFNIQNLGNATLNLTGTAPSYVTISGANASDFVLTQPTAATVAAGGSVPFTIAFAPTSTGSKTATITIDNDDSTGNEAPYIFTVTGTGVMAPAITSFTPITGPVGTAVTIMGTDFTAASTVSFNGTAATAVTFNSATSLTATVPGGATTGPITVATTYGSSTSTTSFTVTPTPTAGLLLLEDNFAYAAGESLTSHGWTGYSGTSTVPPATVAGNLAVAQYPRGFDPNEPATFAGSSSVRLSNVSNQDVSRSFDPTTGATFYAAAVINVSNTASGGDYFLSFADATNSSLRGRIYIQRSGTAASGNFQLGIGAGSLGSYTTGTPYSGNTPYLVVLKYTSTSSTETASLFLYSAAADATEPTTPLLTVSGPISSGAAPLTNIVLRQADNGLTVDGLRVATNWGSAIGRPVFVDEATTLQPGSYYSVAVNGTTSLTTTGAATVEGSLSLNGGKINTDATSVLTLTATAAGALSGGSATSFVNGPLARVVPATSNTSGAFTNYSFPVGKGTAYRPLTLRVNSQTSTTTYRAEQVEGNPGQTGTDPTATDGTTLTRVSRIRSYTITPLDGSGVVTQPTGFQGRVTLSFGTDDQVTDAVSLQVAKRADSNQPWANIGLTDGGISGTNSGYQTGFVTSTTFSSFSDFALASTDASVSNNPLANTNPLPVELSSFGAQRQADKGVAVKWSTASEKNADRFEVQRSLNGRDFVTVATEKAQGTSTKATSYAMLDNAAPATQLYYRLRQVDRDGTVAYSPVATVAGFGATAKVLLYPNPAHRSISFTTEAATSYRVLNQLGQAVLHGTTEAGTAQLAIEHLPTGLYFLELQTAAGRTVQKFEKE
jgi:hypothetical protein